MVSQFLPVLSYVGFDGFSKYERNRLNHGYYFKSIPKMKYEYCYLLRCQILSLQHCFIQQFFQHKLL